MSDEAKINDKVEALEASIQKLESQNEKLIGEKRNWTKQKTIIESKNAEILDQMETDDQRRLFEAGNIDEAFSRKYHSTISKKDDSIRDLEVEINSLRDRNERMSIESIAKQTALEGGILPNAVRMVARDVSDHFKMKDGVMIGYTDAGTEMLNDKGETMQMGEYIANMSKTNDYLFVKPGGSGATGTGAGMGNIKKSDMSREQKSAYVEQHGADKFLALPA